MKIDRDILEEQLQAAIDSYAGVFKWNGVEYPASVSEITQRDNVDETGILNESDCDAVVARSAFGEGPIPNNRQVVLLKQDENSEYISFYVEDRISDTISYTFKLMRM
jgi:hypothetical protein